MARKEKVRIEELEKAKIRYNKRARIAWIMFIVIIILAFALWNYTGNGWFWCIALMEIIPYLYLESSVYRIELRNKPNISNICKAFKELGKAEKIYSFNDGERIKAKTAVGTLSFIELGNSIAWVRSDTQSISFFDEFVVYMDKHQKEVIYYEDIKIRLYTKQVAEKEELRPLDSRLIGHKEIDGERVALLLHGLIDIDMAGKFNTVLMVSSTNRVKDFYRHMKLVERLKIEDMSALQLYRE